MTDIAVMTDSPAPDGATAPKKRRGKLLKLALPLVLAGAGFASSWFGFWSPLALLGIGAGAPAAEHAAESERTVFIEVPDINVTIPDARPRLLHLVAKLEVPEADAKEVEHLLPRVLDAVTTFLTGIAPEAFERRGIVEIIREELRTRVQLALKTDSPVQVLIMEFALK